MHDLAVYMKKGILFLFSTGFTSFIVLLLVNSWTYFLLGSLTLTLTVLLYWIYLFLLVLVFVRQQFFLHWKILIMLLSQFPSTFCHTQNRMLHCIVYDWLCADWDCFHDILEMLLGRKSLNSVFMLLIENFVSGLKLEFMNIPHCNYQVKLHFSLQFSAAGSTAIVHRNHIFYLHQQNKSSESKVKFRQASDYGKRVLEAANLAYVTKTKDSIMSQNLGSWGFWQIANTVLIKDKSAIPPLFSDPELLSSVHLIKQNCLLKS